MNCAVYTKAKLHSTVCMDGRNKSQHCPLVGQKCTALSIRRRSDYIIGFIAPAIGPKSKKQTQLIAPAGAINPIM